MTGKCPHCGVVPNHLIAEGLDIRAPSFVFAGASILCPHCRTILSASIDPAALKTAAVAEIRRALEDEMTKLRARLG